MNKKNVRQIKEKERIRDFLFAGNAKFTLVSKKSGSRFTYRIKASDDGSIFFIQVMTGSDNESSFSYAGIVNNNSLTTFLQTKKSKINVNAPSIKAFSWYIKHIGHPLVEFYHAGKCGKCGRSLTVPESIKIGLGPVCATSI